MVIHLRLTDTRFAIALLLVGFHSIAVNQELRLEKKIPTSIVPCCRDIPVSQSSKAQIQASGRDFHFYDRVTVLLESSSQIHHVNSDCIQQFDIVAVRPTTEKLFQQACMNLEVDIISLNLMEKLPFYLKIPPVQQAIEKGIHFEISYAPTIRDSGLRRRVLANAMDIARVTKGKNVIISSAAEKHMEIRGPYDVANLGRLFGLQQGIAKRSICENCRSVVLHGKARRSTIKSVISCRPVASLTEAERQKLDRYPNESSNKRQASPVKEDEDCKRKKTK